MVSSLQQWFIDRRNARREIDAQGNATGIFAKEAVNNDLSTPKETTGTSTTWWVSTPIIPTDTTKTTGVSNENDANGNPSSNSIFGKQPVKQTPTNTNTNKAWIDTLQWMLDNSKNFKNTDWTYDVNKNADWTPKYVGTGDFNTDIQIAEDADTIKKNKEAEDYAKSQQVIKDDIARRNLENQGYQSSETIKNAANQLDTLKQAVAFLWEGGRPWVSSVHLAAVSKQVSDADTTYQRIVSMENNRLEIMKAWQKFDSESFARDMKLLQDDLDNKVWQATQNAINEIMAKDWKIDTMEDFNKATLAIKTDMDNAIANIAQSNHAQRQRLIDNYNLAVTETEADKKRNWETDEVRSASMWMLINWNWKPVLDAEGNTIPFQKSPFPPSIDEKNGMIITYSTWAKGEIVPTATKLYTPTKDEEKRQQDVNGWYFRTGAGGQLETMAWPWKLQNAYVNGEQVSWTMVNGQFIPIQWGWDQIILNETPVDTWIKNVYWTWVKLAPTVWNMVINAYNALKDQWIDLKIADSTRSFNTQKQSYESWKEWVAKPWYSFHEKWQAIDLSQLAKDWMFVNWVLKPEVKKALEDSWLQQLPSEPRHRSYGEMGGAAKEVAQWWVTQAAWISIDTFNYLTQGNSALTRLSEKTRAKIKQDATDFLNKRWLDISTFQAQYNALSKTVEANSLRNNQAAVAEWELDATLKNVKSAAEEANLWDLKKLNLAKIRVWEQLNDAEASTFKFHLSQLREEFAMYNSAIWWQIDANGNVRAPNESDYKRADDIIQSGFAAGSIDWFEKALANSRSKMWDVLWSSVDAQNKQVRKLFWVDDKYKPTYVPTSTKAKWLFNQMINQTKTTPTLWKTTSSGKPRSSVNPYL